MALDLTPDETATGDTLDSLVNDNPWLIKYLVDGATDETDPNGDIAVIIEDEDPPNDSGDSTGDGSNNNGNGKGKKN